MAHVSKNILDAGDLFPSLKLELIDGSKLDTTKDFKHPWNVILFYRGYWCPFCIHQLKSFQAGLSKLSDEGIGVVAASVDSREKAEEAMRLSGATFPIAFGLDLMVTAEATGAFYDSNPAHAPAPHIHSTGYLIKPDGKIAVAVYSTGAIGRLVWQDVLHVVEYVKENSKQKPA